MNSYIRESGAAIVSPIDLIAVNGRPADFIQAVAAGTVVIKDGTDTAVTLVLGAGDVIPGPIRTITSTTGSVRYGTGPLPIPGPTSAASASASAASTSATAAAASATTASTQATNAATSATAAAASAVTAAGYGLAPSATVITADPAPAVIGTLYVCNPSGGAFNVTLPAIGAGNHGKRIGFTVSTTSANAVTPVPAGSDVLPGGFTAVAGTYGFVTLEADNTPATKVWRRVG